MYPPLYGRMSALGSGGVAYWITVLAATEEHFTFGRKARDHTGIGRFICWYLAMDLAGRGDGLVDMNGEWWAPADYARPLWAR